MATLPRLTPWVLLGLPPSWPGRSRTALPSESTCVSSTAAGGGGLGHGACLISLCAGIWVWDWCKLGARKHAGR